jgi:hypothetical protein
VIIADDSSQALLPLVRMIVAFLIVLNIAGILSHYKLLKQSRENLEDLQEFSRLRTVNGIQARQIFQKAAKSEKAP